MRVRAVPLLLLLLLPAQPARPGEEKSEWIELTSSHFHVVSNAGAKKVQGITQQLEDFRHLISQMFPDLRPDPPAPTRVLLFKNEKSVRPYRPLTPEGKPRKLAGFFQPGRERMYLVVDLSSMEPLKTAFHEYMHLFLELNVKSLPVWLDEGVAQYYQHTQITGNRFRLGLPELNAWEFLRDRGLIPLPVLLAVDHRSEYYNVPQKQQHFYAQSWLLVHYLVAGERTAGEPRLSRFVLFLQQGMSPEAAFRQAFGTDYPGMERQLQEYLSRFAVTAYEGKLLLTPEHKLWEPKPLAAAAAQAYAADLWLNSGRVAEAEQALQQLAQSGTPAPEVLYRLGRIALERQQPLEAEKHFQAALAARPDDIGLRYYAAWAITMGGLASAPDATARHATATRVIELLAPLLETPSPFADAYDLLVQARLAREDPPAEIVPLVERIRQRAPGERRFDLLLAHLYLRQERWAEAEKLLQLVLTRTTSATERQQAEAWLRRIRALPAPAASLETPTESGLVRRQPARVEEPVEPPPPPPPAAPAQAGYLRGTLVNVACADDTAVITVVEAAKKGQPPGTVHLAVRSMARVLQIDPTESGKKLACGPAGVPVGINYRVEPQGPNIAGVVITIEFYPRGR